MSGQELWFFVRTGLITLFYFVYTTIVFIASQPKALAQAVYAGYSEDKARRFFLRLGRVLVEDLPLMLAVGTANHLLQNYNPNQQESENTNSDYALGALCFNLFVSSIQFTGNVFATGYLFRKKVQLGIRMVALTLDITDVANSAITTMTICRDEHCNPLRYLKGAIRTNLNYFIFEFLIKLSEYIPSVGNQVSVTITVYHQGRYVMSLILPICNRHQEAYMVDNPELVLSHGLVFQSLSTVIPLGIESITGFPRALYQSPLSQILLIMQVNIACRMQLPKPVNKSNRYLTEPLALLSVVLDVIFEVVLLGLKRYIPQQLQKDGSSIPWDKVGAWIVWVWSNPLLQKLRFLLLPRMLQSLHRFKNDPLISPHWESMRMDTLNVIRAIQTYRRAPLVKGAMKAKKLTVEVTHHLWNLPRFATSFLIDFLQAPGISNRLGDWERYLEEAYAGDPQLIVPASKPFNADLEPQLMPVTPREHPLADADDEVNLDAIQNNEIGNAASSSSQSPVGAEPVSTAADEMDIVWNGLNQYSFLSSSSSPLRGAIHHRHRVVHPADDEDSVNLEAFS